MSYTYGFFKVPSLFMLISLASCTNTQLQICDSMDWRKEGEIAALKGFKQKPHFSNLKNKCLKYKTPIEEQNFKEGYARGLAQFCTTTSGFDFGFLGKDNPEVCPIERQSNFLKGYYKGRLAKFEQDLKNLNKLYTEAQDRVWRKEQDYALLQSQDPEQAKLEIDILESYRSETKSLEKKKESTTRELFKTKKLFEESFF